MDNKPGFCHHIRAAGPGVFYGKVKIGGKKPQIGIKMWLLFSWVVGYNLWERIDKQIVIPYI